jgi:hypothetical protein
MWRYGSGSEQLPRTIGFSWGGGIDKITNCSVALYANLIHPSQSWASAWPSRCDLGIINQWGSLHSIQNGRELVLFRNQKCGRWILLLFTSVPNYVYKEVLSRLSSPFHNHTSIDQPIKQTNKQTNKPLNKNATHHYYCRRRRGQEWSSCTKQRQWL